MKDRLGEEAPWIGHHIYPSSLDYFLSGHLKFVVCQNRSRTLDDLKDTTTECQWINTETLKRAKASFIKRIDACVNIEGEQFEHLL